MNLTDVLALIAIIISVIFGGSQMKASRKQKELEDRLNSFESKKGEITLFSILMRYFLTFHYAWDVKTKKVKTDVVNVTRFISEVEIICTDLNNLINNPFYIKLIEEFPQIIDYNLKLRRSLVEQKSLESSNFKLEGDTFQNFNKLFKILKEKSENNIIFETDTIKELIFIIGVYEDQIDIVRNGNN